jgi:hypothetical protein
MKSRIKNSGHKMPWDLLLGSAVSIFCLNLQTPVLLFIPIYKIQIWFLRQPYGGLRFPSLELFSHKKHGSVSVNNIRNIAAS